MPSAEITDEEGRELLPVEVPPAACVDVGLLQQANPACPERLSLQFLLDEAATLDVASHACEHLGVGDWHDEDAIGQTQLDLARFAELAKREAEPMVPFRSGFDVSRDRRRAALAIAGTQGENIVVKVDSVQPGVDWIPGRLEELGAAKEEDAFASVWSNCDTVTCDAYQERLAEQIRATTGIAPELLDRAGVAKACARFVDLVNQGVLRHDGNPLPLDALKGATVVSVSDAGWAFSRRTSGVDLSPLYACVFALAGWTRTTQRPACSC